MNKQKDNNEKNKKWVTEKLITKKTQALDQ